MTKILFWIILIIFITSSQLISQPKFNIVGGNTFDYGDLYYGIEKKTLTIKNLGTDTLIISNVSASCGCTGTLMSSDHIAPNDSGALEISLDTKKALGKVQKAVSLETNDPENKKVRITFTANVIPTLDIQPEYLFFRGSLDSTTTQQLKISNPSNENIKILSISSSLDIISMDTQTKSLKPKEEFFIKFMFTPKNSGTFKGNIEIKTNHPRVPIISVRVVGLVPAKS